MISALRRYLDTWIARGFFLLMVAAFIIWGVGDVVRLIGTDTWVAKVGGQTIEVPEAQQAFQKQMNDLSRRMSQGTDVTPEMRHEVANGAVQGLISQAVIAQEEQRLGIVVPDQAVRQAVFAIPQFHGASGQFDRTTFEAVLRNNGLTEPRFLEIVRANLAEKQLLETVAAGAEPPRVLVDQIFDYQFEKRSADMVELPFSAVPAPPAPAEAVLRRWYDNIRTCTAARSIAGSGRWSVPETLAKDIPVTDADLHAAYDARKAQYVKPERRSVQVIQAPDAAKAQALASEWRGSAGQGGAAGGGKASAGKDWAAMQAAAKDAGGWAIELDDVLESGLPTEALGHAVFSATPDMVSDPTQGAAGWQVLKVTKVTPGSSQTFDQAKDALRQLVVNEKAADVIYDRANKVDNILASGSGLNELPDNLAGRGRRHAGHPGQHHGRQTGADPRRRCGAPGDHRSRVPGTQGRPAAADRGAAEGHRRVGLLRPDRRGRDPARSQAVRPGEGHGAGGLDPRRGAAHAGDGGSQAADCGAAWPEAGRCGSRCRRGGDAHTADRTRTAGPGRAIAVAAAAVRPEACRANHGGDPGQLHRRGAGADRGARPEERSRRLRPGAQLPRPIAGPGCQ